MALANPQGQFEDSIFGPNGMHPTPKTLPYPTQPLTTIYGETIEYLVPEGQKEKVLKKLFPFGNPPPLNAVYMDIHAKREFTIRDYKVVEQNGYVMPVSPYFAEDGASVVDWEPKSAGESGLHVSPVVDSVLEGAFNTGYADGFTGMPEGAAKPPRAEGMDRARYDQVGEAYRQGYEAGSAERRDQQMPFTSLYTAGTNRRTGRRPR